MIHFLDASVDSNVQKKASHSSLSDVTASERDTEVVGSPHSGSSTSLQRSASLPTRQRNSAFQNSNRSRICMRQRPQQQQQRNGTNSLRHQSSTGASSNTEHTREAEKSSDETLSTESLTAGDNKPQLALTAPPTSPTHHPAISYTRLTDMYSVAMAIDGHSTDGTRFSVELVEKLPIELLEAIKNGTLPAETYAMILRRQKDLRQGRLPFVPSHSLDYVNNDLMWWEGMCVCVCACACVCVRACMCTSSYFNTAGDGNWDFDLVTSGDMTVSSTSMDRYTYRK